MDESLRAQIKRPTCISLDLGLSLDEVEKIYIQETLKMVKGNQTKAANTLKVHRNTLHRLIEKMDIQKTDYH